MFTLPDMMKCTPTVAPIGAIKCPQPARSRRRADVAGLGPRLPQCMARNEKARPGPEPRAGLSIGMALGLGGLKTIPSEL